MADPAEVKVGSELVFRGRVESVQPNGVLVRFATELASSPGRTFMSKSEVERAEVGMADLSKVKVGDTLRIDGYVMEVERGFVTIALRPNSWDTIVRLVPEYVELAEHIPAPKTFKRGDWVRWSDGDEEHRHCLVLGPSSLIANSCTYLRIDVPGDGSCLASVNALEPDEAPE